MYFLFATVRNGTANCNSVNMSCKGYAWLGCLPSKACIPSYHLMMSYIKDTARVVNHVPTLWLGQVR